MNNLDDETVKYIRSIDTVEPKQGFEMLSNDYCMRARRNGVSEFMIRGFQLALMIAFRLGEKAGLQKQIEGLTKERDGLQ